MIVKVNTTLLLLILTKPLDEAWSGHSDTQYIKLILNKTYKHWHSLLYPTTSSSLPSLVSLSAVHINYYLYVDRNGSNALEKTKQQKMYLLRPVFHETDVLYFEH